MPTTFMTPGPSVEEAGFAIPLETRFPTPRVRIVSNVSVGTRFAYKILHVVRHVVSLHPEVPVCFRARNYPLPIERLSNTSGSLTPDTRSHPPIHTSALRPVPTTTPPELGRPCIVALQVGYLLAYVGCLIFRELNFPNISHSSSPQQFLRPC
jgi:hypothetical protein